jgi:hypothetical protein
LGARASEIFGGCSVSLEPFMFLYSCGFPRLFSALLLTDGLTSTTLEAT